MWYLLAAVLPYAVALEDALAGSAIVLDGHASGLEYDGHGGLSAGASSRLLYDYSEPHRSNILDYLFKPNFGAALHQLKVEIGGDSQSTDGTEPSHMHHRDDLSCERGYEFWLLQEAKKRNPNIVTFALSWAVPYWVGNQTGYYCDDNIDYHIKWLECAKMKGIDKIDYIGNWNERSWGPADWTIKFRQAMDAAKFQDTKIVIPDGGYDPKIVDLYKSNASFANALKGGGVGLHYPCNKPHPEVQEAGLKYWSSEDYSTVGDWAGAGCWGRILNQNFVRMNMTSTVSWSLIWSVYPGLPYFGNGLMYAFEPWSGYYTVNGPIWTSAHTTQFVDLGWTILGTSSKSSGSLANGGSYLTYLPPKRDHFTLVVEKLHGRCLRCAGQTTTSEALTFQLANGLELLPAAASGLSFWSTNETHQFVKLPDLVMDKASRSFSFIAEPDTIYSVSTTKGQAKGSVKIPDAAPFPVPYSDNFDGYVEDAEARYFADDGGSWLIAPDPTGHGKMVLKQWVTHQAGVNAWVPDTDPISVIADQLNDTAISVDIYVPNAEAPPKPAAYYNIRSKSSGQCLDLAGKLTNKGAVVDTWSCARDWNEQFQLDSATGRLTVSKAAKLLCVGYGECPSAARSDLCLVDCSGADDVRRVNQTWQWSADNTIRLRGSSLCLTAGGADLDAPIRLHACTTVASAAQQWLRGAGSDGMYAGVCARLASGKDRTRSGYCLNIGVNDDGSGHWRLQRDGIVVLASGIVASPLEAWHTITLTTQGGQITAGIDGHSAPAVQDAKYSSGAAALNSGWGVAYFDNFKVEKATEGIVI